MPDHWVPGDTSSMDGNSDTTEDADIDSSVDDTDASAHDGAASDGAVADAGPDTSTTVDSGLPAAASLWASTAIPAFDAATVAHVRQVRATGQTKGNRLNVVAKLGDSITAQPYFFFDVGDGNYLLGNYQALLPTIAAIRGVTVGAGKNSFNRTSTAATGGWTSGDVLSPTNHVQGEVAAIRPGYAIVMFGTNDGNDAVFETNMNQIIDDLETEGVVAVMSTIPDRTDYNGAGTVIRAMNTKVHTIASQRHMPLIDLFVALAPLPNSGLGPDNIHPSVFSTTANDSAYFTDAYLQYGYNVRNLTAVQMLDRLHQLP